MASRSLGTLTLDLIAKIGGYEQGLDKAEREAKKRAAAIEKAFDGAFSAITAGFAALAAAGTAALAAINAQADAIAGFQDLADKIGDSAEQIATLQQASMLSGVALDTVAAASIKLTSALSKTDDEGKAAGLALKDIGLSFEEFKRLSPVEQIDTVARAFAKFEDGAGKTATAVTLFGKSGADIIPFLNDLADEGERQVKLTGEQIAAADEYTKATARLKAEFQDFTQQQTAQYIPVLAQVQSILAEVAKSEEVVATVTWLVEKAVKAAVVVLQTLLVVGSDIVFTFKMVGKEIGAMAAQLAALARLDFAGFSAISDMVTEDAKKARKELDAFQARVMRIGQPDYMDDEVRRLMNRSASANQVARPSIRPTALPSGGGSKDDPAKKALEAQLKELDRFISREKDLMAERNKFLDLYNGQGLLSIRDYYERQANIRDEATQKQSEAYEKQIKLLQDYIAKANPKDRASAQEKLNDLLEKQAKLQRDAGTAAIEAGIKQTQAMKEYANTIAETNARLLELQGEVGKAAAIRFDIQNEGLLKLFSAEGNQEMIEKVARIRELTVAQADLNKLSADYGLIQGQLQIAEDRIALAQKIGTQGEIEGLLKLGEARRASYDQLKAIAEQYERIAAASGDPQMILKAEQLKLSLEQLGAELDPLAQKFDQIFSDSLGNALSDFITGTKSAKDAFKDFANDVINQISKMVAQSLTKQLFGNLFGGASGGGGFGSWLSGIFGGIGARANGGPVQPNSLYRVNERGPELFQAANGDQFLMTGTQAGDVIPNGKFGGAVGQTLNVNIQGYVKRDTPNQIAMEVRRQSNIAAARFR